MAISRFRESERALLSYHISACAILDLCGMGRYIRRPVRHQADALL